MGKDLYERAFEELCSFFGAELSVTYLGDNEIEYSLNGYVIDKETFALLRKAGVPVAGIEY